MRIAVFYSDNPFAGWIQTHGFAEVLERVGHEVVRIAIPCQGGYVKREDADRINKPIDDCDLIIVSGPEWLRKWIQAFYPQWSKLKAPKVGWYHESFVREDFTLDYANYERMFDFHFFPDKNDAEKYRGEFLPLGVDTAIFKDKLCCERDIEVGFIGLMYPKRGKFVEEVKPLLGDINIQMRYACQSERGLIPAVAVFDFDGLNVRKSMELLADTYRRIKVFVTFPSMSSVVVAKVLESLACGCTLVCPTQPVSLPCYEYTTSAECAEQVRRAVVEARNGAEYIEQHHRMELRFETIFEKAGACVTS